MGMILRIASSRIVGQGDIVGRSGYFSLNLSANSVMRGRLDARRTLKSLVADLRIITFFSKAITILALRQERPTMDCCKIRPQLLIGYIATNCFVLIRCSINIPSMRYWLMSGTLIPGKSRIRQRLVSLRVSPWQM